MDVKKSTILYQILLHPNCTKLDLRTYTGYSMTTVIKYVDLLQKEGLITCGERAVKSGKTPSSICINEQAEILGLGVYKDKACAVRVNVKGDILAVRELTADAPTSGEINTLLAEVKGSGKIVSAGCIGPFWEELHAASNCPVVRAEVALGIASFYRFYQLKSNVDIAVLYLDEKITLMKSGEKATYYEVSGLFSPIYHAVYGRMTYLDVLAENKVKERLANKFNAGFAALESAMDPGLFGYKERLELATVELASLADKMIKPAVTVIGGSYIPQSILQKIQAQNPYSKFYFAGNVLDAVGVLAASVALCELYRY